MTLKYKTRIQRVLGLRMSNISVITLSTFCVAILTLLYIYRPAILVGLDSSDGLTIRRLFGKQIESEHEQVEDLSKLEADDENLINVIKQHYLTQPFPESERNLTQPIYASLITQYVQTLLKNKKNGFFIEAGANDGEFLSNTLSLEVNHGWTGLLVEADPEPSQKLQAKRRSAWVASSCLSPQTHPTKVEMIRHKEWNGIGNIPGLFKGVIKEGDFSDPFEVQCFPLYSLLLAVGTTQIDYFSLDIEGAELKVLETIPFHLVSIKVISVETNQNTVGITKLLLKHGYKVMRQIKAPYIDDTIFLKDS